MGNERNGYAFRLRVLCRNVAHQSNSFNVRVSKMNLPTNGNGQTKWMLGFFAALLLSIFGLWVTNITSAMNLFQSGATERTARIAALETTQQFNAEKLETVDRKIDQVLDKLDAHMTGVIRQR